MTLRSSLKFLRSNSLRHIDQKSTRPSKRQGSFKNSLGDLKEEKNAAKNSESDSDGEGTVATFLTCTTANTHQIAKAEHEVVMKEEEDNDDEHDDEDVDEEQLDHSEATTVQAANTITTSAADTTVPLKPPSDSNNNSNSTSNRRSLFKRSNSSKRNIVVESAKESARFFRGLVRAHSAKSLLNVLQETEDTALNVKNEKSSSSTPDTTAAAVETTTTVVVVEPDESESDHDLIATPAAPLVPAPHETPSKPAPLKSLQQKPPCMEPLSEEESTIDENDDNSTGRQHVSFAMNADGSVQCAVRLVHFIEDKTDCWYNAHERQTFAENYSSVIEYYQTNNEEYVTALKCLYNIRRLTPQETDRHMQTLANHSHARGLENYVVKKGAVRRRKHMQRVLDAQKMWGWTCQTSPEGRHQFEAKMAHISAKGSIRCRELALRMATLDTHEALISICSPWKAKRRWSEALRQVAAMSTESSHSNDDNDDSNKDFNKNSTNNTNDPFPSTRTSSSNNRGSVTANVKPVRRLSLTRAGSKRKLQDSNSSSSIDSMGDDLQADYIHNISVFNLATITPMRRLALIRGGGGSARNLVSTSKDSLFSGDHKNTNSPTKPKRRLSLTRVGSTRSFFNDDSTTMNGSGDLGSSTGAPARTAGGPHKPVRRLSFSRTGSHRTLYANTGGHNSNNSTDPLPNSNHMNRSSIPTKPMRRLSPSA